MRKSHKTHSSHGLLSRLFSSTKKAPLRRAPRRRDIERLEERQMLAADGVGIEFTNDPLAGQQWHLLANGQLVTQPNSPVFDETLAIPGEDINVLNAWAQNITGKGIQIAILAGGFDLDHEDLGNFVTSLGIDFVDDDNDPRFVDPNDYEGTALAGLVGATANNGLGGAGVAFDADLIPIRIDVDFGDSTFITSEEYVRAFTYLAGFANDLDLDGIIDPITQSETVEIYLHAWDDDTGVISRAAEFLDPAVLNALQTSVALGRPYWDDANGDGVLNADEVDSYKALGSIHIVPTGDQNGPNTSAGFQDIGFWDSAVYSELVNTRFTISVGSVDHGGDYENPESGTVSSWPSISPSTLIVAPAGSSGLNGLEVVAGVDSGSGLTTTDITGALGKNGPPVFGFEADGDFLTDTNYTSTFSETSGAAAQVAGAVALMLEANPELTYREVQYILMASARQNDQFSETWITNPFRFFANGIQAPTWASYDFDTDGEPGADIENGIIPDVDPDSGLIRNYFTGVVTLNDTDGVISPDPDFEIPVDLNDADMNGIPDGMIVPGLLGSEDMPIPLTLVGPGPDPIFVFPEGTVEALNDSNFGVFNLLSPASALKDPLQFENGAGFTVSSGIGTNLEEIGYAHGVLDVNLAVELAQKFKEFDLSLPEEVSVTTGVQSANGSTIRIQPQAIVDIPDTTTDFVVPGGIGINDINTAWFDEWFSDFSAETLDFAGGAGMDNAGNPVTSGEIITDAPFFDPDTGGFIDLPDNPRGPSTLAIPLEPGVVEDFLSVEWVEFRTNIASGDIDHVRLTLVSPDGTHTELTPFRYPAGAPDNVVFQFEQSAQGSPIPNLVEIIDNNIGGGTAITNQIDGSEEFITGSIELDDPLQTGEAWTFSTNRHWGELLSIEANSEDGGLTNQQWTIEIENWGTSAVEFTQYEVAFHGTEATGSRIQGKIGVDDNKQDIDNIDNDERFNFDRFLTFGELSIDPDGDPTTPDVQTISVVLDDGFDSVFLGEVYETRDPDTGTEFRYAVISDQDYVDAASNDPTISGPALSRILSRLADAEAAQPLLGFGLTPAATAVVSLREQFGITAETLGDPITYQNFDFSQESFELGVVVQAEQIRTDHAPRTASGVAGATSTPVSTGVVQTFLTGADGNYFFDVEATPEPPNPLDFATAVEFDAAYDNWFHDHGGVTYQYKITLENVDDNRRIDKAYQATPTSGSILYNSADLGYQVDIFAADNVLVGGRSITKDVNFLLKIDPADTNVEVAGTVFLDFDSDGVVDPFDTPAAGVTVYYDADGSDSITAGDVTAVTGVNGTYTLTIAGLPAEQSVDIRIDQSTIAAGLETQDPMSGERTLTATPGEGLSASFTLQPVGGIGGIINGTVFNDADENGALDLGESGVEESQLVRVYVDVNGNGIYDADPDGNPVTDDAEPSTFTGTNGAFTISSQTEGTFDIRVDLVGQPFRQTTPLANAGISVSILAGQVSSGLLFGVFDQRTQDFGDLFVDATHNYPTLAIDDGARHTVVAGFFLGSGVDIDEDGATSFDGLGDDLTDGNDDEDGVVLVSPQILPNSTITFDITATGAGGSLNAWIDFNNDGDWNDPGEQIAVDAGLASGQTNRRSFATPSDVDISAGFLAARFRWGPFGLGFAGAANSGEVEDYLLPTTPQVAIGGQILVDANGDGLQDAGDTPAAGVVVFYDVNQDGVKNVGEISATTNAGGTYNINIPAVSTFDLTLRVDASTLPSGTDFLSPPDGIFARTVTPGEVITSDFLLAPQDQLPQGVTGSIFEDADNNGAKNGAESGLAGVTVELYSGFSFDVLAGTAVTDINGNYEIEAPQAGTFEVRLNLGGSTFLTQTAPAGGQQVVINGGQVVALSDFGVFDQSATFTNDYGDLFVDGAHNYPTLLTDDGARHTVTSGVFLGAGVDRDPGTLTSTDATDDDLSATDDEDGVTLFSKDINPDSTIEIDVKATGIGATLDAWIDFNDDGDWDDAGERITTGLALTSGATTRIQVTTPSDVSLTAQTLAARFRWGAGTVGYTGAAASGEVEDYLLVTHSPTGTSIDGDYNGDGSITEDDRLTWVSDFGSTSGAGLRSDGNGNGVVDAADYTVWRDALANAATSSSLAFITEGPDYYVAVPYVANVPEFSSPSFVEKEQPLVILPNSSAPVALLLNTAVDSAFAIEGPVQENQAPTAEADAIDSALLEWSLDGPVASAADDAIASALDDDSDDDEESLELALADEVFAL